MILTEQQKQIIQQAAREYLAAAVQQRTAGIPVLATSPLGSLEVAGAFVSLKKDGQLRSCMGQFGSSTALLPTLQRSAQLTATSDPRFPPIAPDELPHLDMETWILFAPELVPVTGEDRVRHVEIGRHGLQLVAGNKRGLLLPGVATDFGWDALQFLQHVSQKAGLPEDAWKDPTTTLYRFEGIPIRTSASAMQATTGSASTATSVIPDLQPLIPVIEAALAAFLRDDFTAVRTLLNQLPAIAVNVILLQVKGLHDPGAHGLCSISLNQPFSFPEVLSGLCQQAVIQARRRQLTLDGPAVHLLVGNQPQTHGRGSDPELQRFDCCDRAMISIDRTHWGIVYDCESRPDAVAAEVVRRAAIDVGNAQLFSVAVRSTSPRMAAQNAPEAVSLAETRPTAVAGQFYPGDPAEMQAELRAMLADVSRASDNPRVSCAAVMVPHAGWRYSGRLATDVFNRTELPDDILIIGPKHTARGVDLAVEPAGHWQIPGAMVPSSPELTGLLTRHIPGMQADVAAHDMEHGIEVLLPIIHELAPTARVTGVVIGRGDVARCDEIAEGLATVLKEYNRPVLLVISSDMNHFATDEENRRLDALALEQFDALNEEELYRVCRRNRISMCGLLPAVIVLRTLKKMNCLQRCIAVGYGTSADVSGQKERVVGYAGRQLLSKG